MKTPRFRGEITEATKKLSVSIGKKITIWIDEKKLTGKIDDVGPARISFRADGDGELVSIEW
jgi:hypothetical protein